MKSKATARAATMDNIAGLFNYFGVIVLMMLGFYIVMDSPNLVKKMIGLNIFQVAVFIFYITLGKVAGGSAPIADAAADAAAGAYSNPLPHVLILTAIVVGVATTALGLAIIIRIQRAYGSVNENAISAADAAADAGVASPADTAAAPPPESP